MCDDLKIVRDFIARRACVFNFLPSCLPLFLADQQKVKEKFLCGLCDSSEAGGESISKK